MKILSEAAMWTVRTGILALLLVAACDGNPLDNGGGGGGGGGTGSGDGVSTLPGTANPSADSDIERRELKVTDAGADYGNGFAEGFTLDEGNPADPNDDTFIVNNLAFDGDNVYAPSAAKPVLGAARVFEADMTAEDDQTGTQIDQFSYRALYGVSTTGRTSFAIVRTGSYIPYGFGGFIYSRDGNVVLPTTGQANFTGDYAGLRDFNGRGGLQLVEGDMEMSIDFGDFDDDEGGAGNGNGIYAEVTNRRIFDLDGTDITASVLAEINADKSPDVDLTELPTLVFAVGPGVSDDNGEAEGEVASGIEGETFESGKYYAVIAGEDADEVAGVIVVTASVGDATWRETGGFILYRQ
jgi:hypothetical protein